MTTLVTGASGQLGHAFRKRLTQNVFFADRNTCNLIDPEALHRQLDKIRPDTIINCAAYTAVDDAIGGWTTAGIDQSYGNGYPLDVLNKWMQRIS